MDDEPVSTLRRIATLTAAFLFLLTVVPAVSLSPDVPEVAPTARAQINCPVITSATDTANVSVNLTGTQTHDCPDPCNYTDCSPSTDPCTYIDCGTDPCDYVNCNPSIPCKDQSCPADNTCISDYIGSPDIRLEGERLPIPAICTKSSICEYAGMLVPNTGQADLDCVQRICKAEAQLGVDLAYTGDRDGDAVEDCHDLDKDGDLISDDLEGMTNRHNGTDDGDNDDIPDVLDLIPGDNEDVKVWVRIESFDQVDWEDDSAPWNKPDPYLKSRAGVTGHQDPADPGKDNRMVFDGMRLGDHTHDELNYEFNSGDKTRDYTEVASNLSQKWTWVEYDTLDNDIDGDGAEEDKIHLRWELPLWEHDGHDNIDWDDSDGKGIDDSGPDLADEWFLLKTIAKTGHHAGDLPDTAENPSDIEVGPATLVFGSDTFALSIKWGANLPTCSLDIARNYETLQEDGAIYDSTEDLGNAFIGLPSEPLWGRQLTSTQVKECGAHSGTDGPGGTFLEGPHLR